MIRAVGLELRAAAPDPAERLGVGEGWAVRPARADEAQALHELAAATFPLACPPHTTPDAIRAFIDEHLSVAAFERYLADPDREILVFPGHLRIRAGHRRAALRAFAPDDLEPLLGYTMLVHGEPGDEDVRRVVTARPATELSKCYVRAEAHGGGTAHVLMTASIGAARARGARVIWLGVNNENERAQRFYGKHGFERIGEKRFKVGDRYEHDDVLARALA
ncbi:MAG: GNAT family N-acetyltransferase [Microbacteriaceae bacterium]|nr:GNAT family N-acetyltransferase [Microbacteriaceae bacterium]